MPVESKKEWQEWVTAMTHAYNCTVSKTTAYSPYFLMYEREPQLPINKEFNLPNDREPVNLDSYVERLLNKMLSRKLKKIVPGMQQIGKDIMIAMCIVTLWSQGT